MEGRHAVDGLSHTDYNNLKTEIVSSVFYIFKLKKRMNLNYIFLIRWSLFSTRLVKS